MREKSGLVYFVNSSFNIGLTRGIYQVQYACDPPNVAKARAVILSNLRDLQHHKITDAELQQAKLMLLRDIPLGEASIDGIAGAWLARSAVNLPLDEPVRAGRVYTRLDASDVKKAWARWLRPDDLVQITQGPVPK